VTVLLMGRNALEAHAGGLGPGQNLLNVLSVLVGLRNTLISIRHWLAICVGQIRRQNLITGDRAVDAELF